MQITIIPKKRLIPFTIWLMVALFVCFFSYFNPIYDTSDDIEQYLSLVSDGGFGPTLFSRFSHYWVSSVLIDLYKWMPIINWYPLMLYGFLFTGFSLGYYSFLKSKWSHASEAYLLLLVICGLPMMWRLQFTSATFVLGQGLLFFNILGNERALWKKHLVNILGLLAIALVRVEVFWLIFTCLAIHEFVAFCMLGKGKKWELLGFPILIVLVLALQWENQRFQSKIPNAGFFFKNKSLGVSQQILDYKSPKYYYEGEKIELFRKAGWSDNDYKMFEQWFMADTSVYGTQSFLSIEKAFSGEKPFHPIIALKRIKGYFQHASLSLKLLWACWLALLVAMVLAKRKPNPSWLGLTLFLLALFAYFPAVMHLPDRLAMPMTMLLMALPLAFLELSSSGWLGIKGVLVSLAIFSIWNVAKENNKALKEKAYYMEAEGSHINRNMLYAGGGGWIQEKLIRPSFFRLRFGSREFNFLDFGHLANTPPYYQLLDKFGIKDFHKEAPNHPKVLFLMPSNSSFWERYPTFVREHHGLEIEFEPVDTLPNIGLEVRRAILKQ